MLSFLKTIKQKSFKSVGFFAIFVAAMASTNSTIFLLDQPECPKELLK